ncbi:hypothetical protein Tco_0228563 [Tanacetum coccineum]
MHGILNEPPSCDKYRLVAPQGEELGLMNPLSRKTLVIAPDNSFISDGANRYGAQLRRSAPGIKSKLKSTSQLEEDRARISGNF